MEQTLRRVGVATHLPDVPQISWSLLKQDDLIGHGNFGAVYGGRWGSYDVALKVLHIRTLSNEQLTREFHEEVRVMWTCQFPRVVRLYGVCTDAGQLSMVFERMRRSLNDWINSGEDIPEERRLQIAIDIAQGLKDLHSQQVIHRDLKSHNILLNQRGRAKITDFGLAKIRTATNTMTTGGARGTIRWSAPELLGIPPTVTFASDLYSFGMTLWELLTRRRPFDTQPNELVVMNSVANGQREIIPDSTPQVWREVIEGCWSQDPARRPTAEAVFERFAAMKPLSRPVWLPEEEPGPEHSFRTEGFACYPASRSDWEHVLRCYQRCPVPGYDVGKVEVIFNPSMNARLSHTRQLLQQRHGNRRYSPTWRDVADANVRAQILAPLERAAEAYVDDDFPEIKCVSLWHGTPRSNLPSLLSAGYGAFGDTDDGYFGRGIYATLEAEYAQMYASQFGKLSVEEGVLILNWIVTYSPFPIMAPDYDSLNHRLTVPIEHPRYDSHFIPVVPHATHPQNYCPITPPQRRRFTEMVFFDEAQVLPRYIVTLQKSLVDNSNSQGTRMTDALREKDFQDKALQERQNRQVEREDAARRRIEEEAAARRRAEQQERDILRRDRDALAMQVKGMNARLLALSNERDQANNEKEVLAKEIAVERSLYAAPGHCLIHINFKNIAQLYRCCDHVPTVTVREAIFGGGRNGPVDGENALIGCILNDGYEKAYVDLVLEDLRNSVERILQRGNIYLSVEHALAIHIYTHSVRTDAALKEAFYRPEVSVGSLHRQLPFTKLMIQSLRAVGEQNGFVEDCVVYHYFPVTDSKRKSIFQEMYNEFITENPKHSNFTAGSLFRFPTFVDTARSFPDVAMGILFEVHLCRGHRVGVDVSHLSYNPNEDKIIMIPPASFVLTETRIEGQTLHVYLRSEASTFTYLHA